MPHCTGCIRQLQFHGSCRIQSEEGGLLMRWLLLTLCLTLACCNSSKQGRLGFNLPQDASEYEQLGNILVDLDSDRNPMRRLAPLTGDWTLLGSYQPWPDAPKVEIRPVGRINSILANRGLECRYWFSENGQAVEDLYIIQWDPLSQAYDLRVRSTGWPLPTTGTGHWNRDLGTLDFEVKTTNPETGKPITVLYRLDRIEINSHRWQQFRTSNSGELIAFATMIAARATRPTPDSP